MAKNLKLNIKNAQIAEAINLSGLKNKLAKKKEEEEPKKSSTTKPEPKSLKSESEELPREDAPRIKARSKSAFAESQADHPVITPQQPVEDTSTSVIDGAKNEHSSGHFLLKSEDEEPKRVKTSAELRQDIFGDLENEKPSEVVREALPTHRPREVGDRRMDLPLAEQVAKPFKTSEKSVSKQPSVEPQTSFKQPPSDAQNAPKPNRDKLGPTGRHIKDYYKQPQPNRANFAIPQKALENPEDRNKNRVKQKAPDADPVKPASNDE